VEFPYGSPEGWDQQARESERFWASMNALAYFHTKVTDQLGADHLAHLRSEAGISEREFNYYVTKKAQREHQRPVSLKVPESV
jgi:hypothetical protein